MTSFLKRLDELPKKKKKIDTRPTTFEYIIKYIIAPSLEQERENDTFVFDYEKSLDVKKENVCDASKYFFDNNRLIIGETNEDNLIEDITTLLKKKGYTVHSDVFSLLIKYSLNSE